MKVILSRKGFDSTAGGWPSPILPDDGRLLSLPIPWSIDTVSYRQLKVGDQSYYDIMNQLFKKKNGLSYIWESGKIELDKDTKCHFDPDLRKDALDHREKGWKPLFGQGDQAQSHLDNNKVNENEDDLFLFYGLFQETKYNGRVLVFDKAPKHVIWGYLQIGKIWGEDHKGVKKTDLSFAHDWMKYHPHCRLKNHEKIGQHNTIYESRDKLSFNNSLGGAGTFVFDESLQLTKDPCKGVSTWKLDESFRNVKISYHSPKSWNGDDLKSASRGQEFVVDTDVGVTEWVKNLFKNLAEKNKIIY